MPDDLPCIPKKKRPRNKPRDSVWLHQKLRAYRPIYTFRCALPGVFIYSFLCLSISIVLYKNSLKAFEYKVDYTECHQDSRVSHYYINKDRLYCQYTLELPDVNGQVMFYYVMHDFYQNIRKYEQSRNDMQMIGDLQKTDDCYPFVHVKDEKVPIVPCGAIANSMFNDTFNLFYWVPGTNYNISVPLTSDGLLHQSFRQKKYRNPQKCSNEDTVCPGFENTDKPPAWSQSIAQLGDQNNGRALENFDFIQWMETAALPKFRKLYRKLDQQAGNLFANGLPAGNYTLMVEYNYNVTEWNGKKLFMIQMDGPLGPKAFFQVYGFLAISLFLFLFGDFIVLVEFAPVAVDKCRNLLDQLQPADISGL